MIETVLKANPFLFCADDYHEFKPMQELLKDLFPDYDVTFKEVPPGDVARIENVADVQVGNYRGYAAWFTLSQKIEPAMPVEDVVKCMTQTIKLLNDRAADTKDKDLIKLYQADADDYMRIRSMLRRNETTEALSKLAGLDTASREKIWMTEAVQANRMGFTKFLVENEYPNILDNGSVY